MRLRERGVLPWLLFALTLVIGASWATEASADGRVRIGRIRGPGGRVVERSLADALRERGVEVTDEADVRIDGRIRRRGSRRRRRYRLDLEVHLGDQVERVRVTRRRPGQLTAAAAEEIVPLLRATADEAPRPIEEPEPEPVHQAREQAPEAPTPPAPAAFTPGYGEPALEFAAGLEWFARHLSFADDIFDRIGNYRLDAAPALTASVRWFPARHWTSHPLAGLGVEAEARRVFGVSSSTPDGEGTYATAIDDWRIGPVFHMRMAEILQLEGGLTYGEARFRIDPVGPASQDRTPDPLPSVRYRFLRPALGLDVDLVEGLSVGGSAGWRVVLSSGQLAYPDWFPRSFTSGVDLGLRVTWRFDRWFAVRAEVTHVRYISALNPQPGDGRVAGGALDEWTHAGVEFVTILPGAP